ncbi:MAG TPA: outer membrane beta-barrel family protein [Puia sp.]|nr:outer membrane beta-barrel family protein [Puia sp.]
MRKTALLLLILLSYAGLRAQEISGFIKDSQGKPLAGASVALKKRYDSSIIKLGISDTTGRYSFSAIPAGAYFVAVSHVGYTPANSTPFGIADYSATQAPTVILVRASRELKEAEVTAVKPLVEVKPDKIILNVEGNINAIGENALDLLRKSPGVTVDNNNNLGLSGKNGVQVYVDGRPAYLSGNDLAQYLKTILSSSIESIEIISNPSARYEAAGTAGIINIRLKKDKSLGTNLTASAGYNIGTYSKYNANVSFNHRDQHLNVFGNYTYNNATDLAKAIQNRTQLDTLFRQQDVLTIPSVSHTFRGGLDYFFNKKSTLGVLVSGTFSTDSIRSNSNTPIIYIPTNVTSRMLVADNRTSELRDDYTFNLNYHYADSSGHELTLNADYGLYRIRSNQLQPNNYFDSTGKTFLYSSDYNILSPTNIDIYSFKADYQLNVLKGQLGVGGKISYVTSANNFLQYDLLNSGRMMDSLNSDNFNYKENINAVYVNYNRTFKHLTAQAGLRVENTNSRGVSVGWQRTDGDFSVYDSTYPRHYTDFFPSASLLWNKDPMRQWSLSYSRRIDRPQYQDVNPFEFKVDDYTFSKGNTQLRPQYANNLGLTWTYKYALSVTLSYSHTSDLFTTVPDTTDRSKTIVTRVNLASQDVTGLNISYSFQYKWYSAFANVNSFYAQYRANFGGPGRIINENIFHTTIYSQHNFRLGGGWTASLTELYSSPNIWEATLKSSTVWSLDAGIQKTLFAGNATLKASVSDIFRGLNYSATSYFAGQYIYNAGSSETRQLKLNFTWRFGNKQVKAARPHASGAEEENKRVKGSGGTP